MTLSRPVVLAVLAVVAATPASAQDSALRRYIRMGLESNLGLAQQKIAARQAEAHWEEGRAAYRLPSLQLDARYSRAEGGRTFEVPVGDLMNPVYSTLNGLMGSQQFPAIENQRLPFLRDREQDTRLRITQPLWNPAARADTRSRRYQANAAQAGTEAARRALVRDIRVAYYSYANAARAVAIYGTAVELVQENERSNAALWQASLLTRDHLHRARAERLEVEADRARAETDRQLAASYLNYLLGREPGEAVELSPADLLLPDADEVDLIRNAAANLDDDAWIDMLAAQAADRRAELEQLDQEIAAATAGMSTARSVTRPSLALAIDAGIQGREYGIGNDHRYLVASLVLSWSITNGGAERARVRQASLERDRLQAQRDDATARIRLELESAALHARSALLSISSSAERVQEAEGAFRLVRRRREEGLATPLEFLDSRAALTRAQLNANINETEALIRMAELDFATGAAVESLLSDTDRGPEDDR
jgi:outer membrane protein